MILVAAAIVAATLAGIGLERRYGARADRWARQLIWTILNVLLPFIVFVNIVGFDFSAGVGAGLLFGYVGMACSCGVAYLLGSRVLRLERASLGAVMTLSFSANTGYLGLPVVTALLGTKALDDAIAYDVLVSSPGLLIGAFAVGAAFGTHAAGGRARTASFFRRNPALYALLAGLLAPSSFAPHALVSFSHVLAVGLAPLGFLAVGIVVGHERAFALTPPVAVAVACKLLIPVTVLALLATTVAGVPEAFLVQAAMACGVYNIVVAHTFGLNRAIVAPAVLWSTVVVLVVALIIASV